MKKVYAIFIACLLLASCGDKPYKVKPYYSSDNPDSLIYVTYIGRNYNNDDIYSCYVEGENEKLRFAGPIQIVICDSSTPYLTKTRDYCIWYTKKGLPCPSGDIVNATPAKKEIKPNINPTNQKLIK